MRIGIFTFHRAQNYGAFLQAFAMKQILERMGNSAEFIDYWPSYHKDTEIFTSNNSLIQRIKSYIAFLLTCLKRYNKQKKFKALQQLYLGFNHKILYTDETKLHSIEYDAIIYGSDQIWWKGHFQNKTDFDSVYWGQFVNKNIRKIAYAPSMGMINVNEADKQFISKNLNNFFSISAREKNLQDFLITLSNKPVSQVLDPTFLLPKEEWKKFLVKRKINEQYLLLFNLCKSKETEEIAIDVAKKLNLKIVEVTGSVTSTKIGANILQTEDPFEFISLINYSSFVVTSSFHGTAFSIILNKEFIACGFRAKSDRAKSLLSAFGLCDRFWSQNQEFNLDNIDYESVEIVKEQLVTESYSFLRNSLYGIVQDI